MSALEATVVGTAMPTVIADLGGLERYGWVSAAYMLASTVSMPIYGKLADLRGRRPTLIFGIVLFLFGSLVAGGATSMTMLVLARGLQGLGAGAMQPVAITIVGDLFTLQEAQPRAGAVRKRVGHQRYSRTDPRRAVRRDRRMAMGLLDQRAVRCAVDRDADAQLPRSAAAAAHGAHRLDGRARAHARVDCDSRRCRARASMADDPARHRAERGVRSDRATRREPGAAARAGDAAEASRSRRCRARCSAPR